MKQEIQLETSDQALLDRRVHYVVILEMNGESYSLNDSQKRQFIKTPA